MAVPFLATFFAYLDRHSPSPQFLTIWQRNAELANDTNTLVELSVFTTNRPDLMTYFEIFPHLSLEPGYTLDFYYNNAGHAAAPILYVRQGVPLTVTNVNDTPFDVDIEFVTQVDRRKAFLDHVRCDGSPIGFLELAALHLQADQFWLVWHANYHDERLISDHAMLTNALSLVEQGYLHSAAFSQSTQETMKASDQSISSVEKHDARDPSAGGTGIVEFTVSTDEAAAPDLEPLRTFLSQSEAYDLTPHVLIFETNVSVEVAFFTQRGGLIRRKYLFHREFPHVPIQFRDTTLAESYTAPIY